jgi:glycosyltransferase involved in cell wall biosynthesis
MHSPLLAIVIPAYKNTFLRELLESLANQTSNRFRVYIGNDNSPYKLDDIVKDYREKINLVYKKFPNNLGSVSLVQQWDRCISMVEEEEWIWLLGDDDKLSENCVSSFYETLETFDEPCLLRFDKVVIDTYSNIVTEVEHPESVSFSEYLEEVCVQRRRISLPEYVFPKTLYNKFHFKDWPLAWGSDKAAWLEFVGETNCLRKVKNGKLFFRMSNENISSNLSPSFLVVKSQAKLQYLKWLIDFLNKRKLDIKLEKRIKESIVDSNLIYFKENPADYKIKLQLIHLLSKLTSWYRAVYLILKYL